jgi:hypothetical protein
MAVWTRETAERRLVELAPGVASALGDGWKREKRQGDELTHFVGLVRGDERVGLHVMFPYGRVSISGSLNHLKDARGEAPYYRTEDNPKITASLDKTAEQIARDIERRVLPGYRAVLAKVLEVVRQRDEHLALTMESAGTIAKVAGAVVDGNMRGCVSFSGSARLPDLDGSAECSGEAVSLSLSDLTVTEVRAILEVLIFRRRHDVVTP